MRKIAFINDTHYKRLMLYQDQPGTGAYLLFSTTLDDSGSCADEYYTDIQDLYCVCLEEYDVKAEDWQTINDPLPHCQHDIIDPVRVVGRHIGKPEYGTLEKLVDGNWVPWSYEV